MSTLLNPLQSVVDGALAMLRELKIDVVPSPILLVDNMVIFKMESWVHTAHTILEDTPNMTPVGEPVRTGYGTNSVWMDDKGHRISIRVYQTQTAIGIGNVDDSVLKF